MPLDDNTFKISGFMKSHAESDGTVTGIHWYNYNLPVYLIDSTDTAIPRTTVVYTAGVPEPSPTRQKLLFSNDIPIPAWAQPAIGTDSSMAIYDIATGLMREYFNVAKQPDGTWTAFTGGYSYGMIDMATQNYACQLTEGSDFATCNIGAPTQIGVEEARRGSIRHALGVVVHNVSPSFSWPAKYSDGTSTDPSAPAQGQWFRFNPTLDINALGLNPFTTMICTAIQQYGGFPIDKSLFSHYFNCEPGFNEMQLNGGINPWQEGGDLYKKYAGDFDVNGFPWQLTEWAPVDWGKPA